jgi:hypothetical protein
MLHVNSCTEEIVVMPCDRTLYFYRLGNKNFFPGGSKVRQWQSVKIPPDIRPGENDNLKVKVREVGKPCHPYPGYGLPR